MRTGAWDANGKGSRNAKAAGLGFAIPNLVQPALKGMECNEGSASLILELPFQLDAAFWRFRLT